jgi:glycosyl transferase family 87
LSTPPSNPKRNLILVAIVGGILLQLVVAWQLRYQIAAGMPDFSNFYAAGKIVDMGEGGKLYDFAMQARVEGTYTIRADSVSFLRFYHAPFEVLFYAPLALFSFQTAFWIWWACSAVLWASTLLLLRPHLPFLHGQYDLIIIVSSFFFPLLNGECQGQDSILTLFLWTVCFVALKGERPWVAGMAIGFSAYKPQFALPFLLVLVIGSSRRWRVLGGFAVSIAGLVMVSLCLIGLQPFLDYPKALTYARSGATDIHVRPEIMANLRGLILSLSGGHLPAYVATLAIAVLSIGVLFVASWPGARRSGIENSPGFRLSFSSKVAAAILVSYYGYMHDTTPLLLPMLIVCNWLAQTRMKSWNQKILAACVLLLVAFPAFNLPSQALFTGDALALFVLISIEAWRLRSAKSVTSELPASALV